MRFNILVEAEIEFARQCVVAKHPLGFVLINFPGLLFFIILFVMKQMYRD